MKWVGMRGRGAALSNSWVREPDDVGLTRIRRIAGEGCDGDIQGSSRGGLRGSPDLPTGLSAHPLQLSPTSCPGSDILSLAFPFYMYSSLVVSSLVYELTLPNCWGVTRAVGIVWLFHTDSFILGIQGSSRLSLFLMHSHVEEWEGEV